MKLRWSKVLTLSLLSIILLTSCVSTNQKVVSIEVWHHYDGALKIAFDKLVTEFNETEGMGKGIIVEAFSQENLEAVETKIINTANKKVGAEEIPNIFLAYPDVVHKIDQMGIIVDLEDYMKKGEIKHYDFPYIGEGYIGKNAKLKMFPFVKATEIMMINKTDWDKFEEATGANVKEFETWEGLARLAEKYYDWTNRLSTEPDDGKAFFAKDDMANYILVGSQQLGQKVFEIEEDRGVVQIDNEIMRKLWDNYYIPYINGYYGPFGKFSSDDMKIGKIIAYVGSTGEVSYFPTNVTKGQNDSYKIEPLMLPVPNFENTEPSAVLQGANMVVLKSDERHERASVEFLKWVANEKNNRVFSITTGYLPVTKTLGSIESLGKRLEQSREIQISDKVKMSLPLAIEQIEEYNVYSDKAFNNSSAARDVLAKSLINRAKGDRIKVVELMKQGISRKEAVATIATESNFEQWVVRFKMEVRGVVK